MKSFPSVMFVLSALVAVPCSADAQVIGTFTWQTRPYCNLVTVSITQQGGVFQLTGSDNLCGAGIAPVTGTAVPAGGNVALGLSVALPSGRTAHLTATISLATVSGTWTDADGSTGPFAFTTVSSGGSARPAPFSAASITVNQLAPTVYAGTGAAATVSRSDHDHDARYAPRTTTVRLSGYSMHLSGAAEYGTYNGCPTNATNATPGIVPIPLPLGATLNAVVVSVYDAGGSSSYTLNLQRHTIVPTGASSSSIGFASGGAQISTVVTHALAVPAGTVVGADQAFHLTFGTAAFANGLCSVEYTYTVPPVD